MTIHHILPTKIRKILENFSNAFPETVLEKIRTIITGPMPVPEPAISSSYSQDQSAISKGRMVTKKGTILANQRVARGTYDYMVKTTLINRVAPLLPIALQHFTELHSGIDPTVALLSDQVRFVMFCHRISDASQFLETVKNENRRGSTDKDDHDVNLQTFDRMDDENQLAPMHVSKYVAVNYRSLIDIRQSEVIDGSLIMNYPIFSYVASTQGDLETNLEGEEMTMEDVQVVEPARQYVNNGTESTVFYLGTSHLSGHVKVGKSSDMFSRFEEVCRQVPSNNIDGHQFFVYTPHLSISQHFGVLGPTNVPSITSTGHECAMLEYLDTYYCKETKRCFHITLMFDFVFCVIVNQTFALHLFF